MYKYSIWAWAIRLYFQMHFHPFLEASEKHLHSAFTEGLHRAGCRAPREPVREVTLTCHCQPAHSAGPS